MATPKKDQTFDIEKIREIKYHAIKSARQQVAAKMDREHTDLPETVDVLARLLPSLEIDEGSDLAIFKGPKRVVVFAPSANPGVWIVASGGHDSSDEGEEVETLESVRRFMRWASSTHAEDETARRAS